MKTVTYDDTLYQLVPKEELLGIARRIEALKRECGMDPESPQAIRNGQYMSIALAVRSLLSAALTPPAQPAQPVERKPLEWMPIETAPKDGTKILLLVGGTVIISRWYTHYLNGAPNPYREPEWEQSEMYGGFGGYGGPLNPSGWMPLPPPPENGIKGES